MILISIIISFIAIAVVVASLLLRFFERRNSRAELFSMRESVRMEAAKRLGIQLDYDPMNCESQLNFQLLCKKSDCLFARNARLWGSPKYSRAHTIEENISNTLPSLTKFLAQVNSGVHLDGYIIEICGENYCNTLKSFSTTIRRALLHISRNNPSGLSCLEMKSIRTSSWYFSFCNVPIFVTTFAPIYSSSHPRYMHNIHPTNDKCYLLLQPESSFLHHKIGLDNPWTSWDNPITMRDKIRANFKKEGRLYHIPATNRYPVSETIVTHDSVELLDQPVRFWEDR
jgi:hypothetical protein